jgi:tRNA G37 N-methylase TrmD
MVFSETNQVIKNDRRFSYNKFSNVDNERFNFGGGAGQVRSLLFFNGQLVQK